MTRTTQYKEPFTYEDAQHFLNYDPDTGVFTWRFARRGARGRKIAGCTHKTLGYITLSVTRHRVYGHRLAWLMHYGAWPAKEIDHIDGNPSNNAISNLRLATSQQNKWNAGRCKHNKSGFKGVYWHKKRQRWYTTLRVGAKRIQRGYFRTPEEAYALYCKDVKRHHGKFARIE